MADRAEPSAVYPFPTTHWSAVEGAVTQVSGGGGAVGAAGSSG